LVMVASKNVKTIDLLTRFISHMETWTICLLISKIGSTRL
jgi:hypothetical protein